MHPVNTVVIDTICADSRVQELYDRYLQAAISAQVTPPTLQQLVQNVSQGELGGFSLESSRFLFCL